ncbi:DUF1176 domain-containing protein [Sphingomonas sp.]|uniref:DUF1176 domain-containing protein n=1 Tax=Sphingomonas sp. TaxID=28214 RepID=UPI0035C7E75D
MRTVVEGTLGKRSLTSSTKGRRVGDGGMAQIFMWDGRRFRLSQQSEMTECRVSTHFLTTWRARVRRH